MSPAAAPGMAPGARQGLTPGRLVLAVLAILCAGLLLATPSLIKPFPHGAPWYESAAMFPRVALGLAFIAACAEFWLRRNRLESGESEELDSSAASLPRAFGICALFVLYCLLVPVLGYLSSSLLFLLAGGLVAGLTPKATLALAIPTAIALWAIFKLALKVAFGHGWLV